MKRSLALLLAVILASSTLIAQDVLPYESDGVIHDSIYLDFTPNVPTYNCNVSLYFDPPSQAHQLLATIDTQWSEGSNRLYFPHVFINGITGDPDDCLYATWDGTTGPWKDTQYIQGYVSDPEQFLSNHNEIEHNGIWYMMLTYPGGGPLFYDSGDITIDFNNASTFYSGYVEIIDGSSTTTLNWSSGLNSLSVEDYELQGFLKDVEIEVFAQDRWGHLKWQTIDGDDLDIEYVENENENPDYADCTYAPIETPEFTNEAIVQLNLTTNYAVRLATVELRLDGETIASEKTDLFSGTNAISFGGIELTGDHTVADLSAYAYGEGPWGYEDDCYDIAGFTTPDAHGVSIAQAVLHYEDPENDRKDMSASHWNWVSFPRLPERDAWGNYDAETLFAPLTQGNAIDKVIGRVGPDLASMEWQFPYWQHNGLETVHSTKGYKIAMHSSYPDWTIEGDICSSYEQFELNSEFENWVGFFLPNGRNIVSAFGSHWEDVESVKSRTWYYKRDTGGNTRDPNDPLPLPSSDPRGKNMFYGNTYVVKIDETVTDFAWSYNTPPGNSRGSAPDSVQSFTVVEQADYEAIDVVDIDPDIVEIGVFEGDVCVGAVAVDTTNATILAYTTSANRNVEPLSFQIVRDRSSNPGYVGYSVLDERSGEFVNRELISGAQEHSAVRLGAGDASDSPVFGVTLHQNRPNPFNPSTSISFTLKERAEVEIAVYNIRGGKVRTLMRGTAEAGRNAAHWNGLDERGTPVASGVYLYRITANGQSVTRRMTLLK